MLSEDFIGTNSGYVTWVWEFILNISDDLADVSDDFSSNTVAITLPIYFPAEFFIVVLPFRKFLDVAFSRSVFKEHALVSILASMHWSFKYNVTDVVLFSFSTFGGMCGARRGVPSVDLIEDFVS